MCVRAFDAAAGVTCYEEKKEEVSSRASYAAYEDKKEPLPYYDPGAPSPSGAHYQPGARGCHARPEL